MTQRPAEPRSRLRAIVVLVLFTLLLLVSLFLPKVVKESGVQTKDAKATAEDGGSHSEKKGVRATRATGSWFRRPDDPKGDFQYVFDKAKNGSRFLLSRAMSKNFRPDSDAPGGRDLWVQDESGKERLVAENVYRARFSPDGTKIAYTTSDAVLHVEGIDGQKITEVQRVYEPNWNADGTKLVYASVPEDRPIHYPEVLGLTTLDLATGKTTQITDGTYDDVRPEYQGDCVVFVSGGRSGFAAFWRVCPGGQPVQLTNLGAEQVTAHFVPTPYDRTLWTQDKRWLIYDFKSGPREETWGLQFDDSGNVIRTTKFGEGIDPRLQDDGQTIVCVKHDGERVQPIEYRLP